ncbi:MAG: GTPase Era [Eubacteriales bacterium]|jgi:GTP-binding protein Era|nr:GTPase Era [Eubacteriales bacterium]
MTRTAFIAIVGRPNIGKSTIINAILGEKIAIVSSKPQTTRNRITGILTRGDDQYVFLDTPGMHMPKTKLGDYMVRTAADTISEVDACILVVDAEPRTGNIERSLIERIKKAGIPCILAINKTDLSNREKIAETITLFASLHEFHAVVPVSALKNMGIDIIIEECSAFLTESSHFYPDDIATDQPERQIAAEIIREKVLRAASEEIPHGTAVMIEKFEDKGSLLRINAIIICERDSHKGILIGKNGEMLKKIGTWAREDMEAFFNTKVYLDLWVKTKEKWRDSDYNLSNFGYKNN